MPAPAPDSRLGSSGTVWLILCRIAALLAVAASAALYVQYLNPAEAAFCGLKSGCEAVRKSGFSYLGSPLLSIPLGGLIACGVVLWVSVRSPRAKTTLHLTAAGAAFAVVLLALQIFYLHAFCWLCVVVDGSAVLAAVFALLHAGAVDNGRDSPEPLRPVGGAALALAAALAPPASAKVLPVPAVPPGVRALYEPGKINA